MVLLLEEEVVAWDQVGPALQEEGEAVVGRVDSWLRSRSEGWTGMDGWMSE